MQYLPKRIYRSILLSLLLLFILPMEDGCKYEQASAQIAAPQVAVLSPLAVKRAEKEIR